MFFSFNPFFTYTFAISLNCIDACAHIIWIQIYMRNNIFLKWPKRFAVVDWMKRMSVACWCSTLNLANSISFHTAHCAHFSIELMNASFRFMLSAFFCGRHRIKLVVTVVMCDSDGDDDSIAAPHMSYDFLNQHVVFLPIIFNKIIKISGTNQQLKIQYAFNAIRSLAYWRIYVRILDYYAYICIRVGIHLDPAAATIAFALYWVRKFMFSSQKLSVLWLNVAKMCEKWFLSRLKCE